MDEGTGIQWLEWAKSFSSLHQAGLTYTKDLDKESVLSAFGKYQPK